MLREYHKYIFSWDSSAAIWAGINDVLFDDSPTGLMNGKFEKEVDFSHLQPHNIANVFSNINYIDALSRKK